MKHFLLTETMKEKARKKGEVRNIYQFQCCASEQVETDHNIFSSSSQLYIFDNKQNFWSWKFKI